MEIPTDDVILYGPSKFIYEEYLNRAASEDDTPIFSNALYISIYDLQRIGIDCTKNSIIRNIHDGITSPYYFIKRPEIVSSKTVIKYKYYYNVNMVLEAINDYENNEVKAVISNLKQWSRQILKEREHNSLKRRVQELEVYEHHF